MVVATQTRRRETPMSHYQHLTISERESIWENKLAGKSLREIARQTGRSVSTISRELKRNGTSQKYQPSEAQKKYERRRKRCRRKRLLQEGELKDLVVRLLTQQQWSPEQISQRIELERGKKLVSYATIYRALHKGLMGQFVQVNGTDYQIVIYNPVVSLSSLNLKAWAVGIFFLMAVLLLLIIFLTNRFLTRFVFRRISEPLKTLSEGVHQIRDGNLSHRIAYSEKDEFLPICEDFNEMAERLRTSVEQLQKEEESRKELLAGISHDIRSPLTSIRAYVEGLLDGVAVTPEKQRAYLCVIQKKTVDIDEMVRKLFLFSKMELGEFPYSAERMDVVNEIRDFVLASAEEYWRRGLQIRTKMPINPLIIQADPTYFRSILSNLLDNSAKYKEKIVGTAVITAEVAGIYCRLQVDDDGPGVPAEALSRLFDVFYRSDPSRKNPHQGSGLGLAIVAKTLERMGGSICAENLPEGGLRITMKIPLA